MVGSLVVLAVLGTAAPSSQGSSVAIPWLELQHVAVKTTSASLLEENAPEVPPVVDEMLMGGIRLAMGNEMMRFANEILPEGRSFDAAGSGDGDIGGLALICGLLGFFPGFGLGHLIAGNINGFVLFLVIDIIIAGVFFVLFPAAFWFSLWYLPGIIVFLVERVVEAFLAADSATRYRGYRNYGDVDPVPAGGAFANLPRAKPAFTILNF